MRGRQWGRGAWLAAVWLLAAGAVAAQAPDSTAPPPGLRSWTSSRQGLTAGGTVTVIVDEYALARAASSKSASDARDRSFGADVRAGARGGTTSGGAADLDFGSGGSSRRDGRTDRLDRLTAEVTVRIVAVDPSGLLQVQGEKRVVIDEHEQVLSVEGFVRPEDVTRENVVESWRLADARIRYVAEGDLDRPRQGFLSKIFGWIWP